MPQAAKKKVTVIEATPLDYLKENFGALGDYVLVVPIEKPLSDKVDLAQSEHWKEVPTWGIVAAVGSGRTPIGYVDMDFAVGDEVFFTKYGEDVELDGRKAKLVHAAEVKIRRKPKLQGAEVN